MTSRPLPGLGLAGDWDLGEDGWKPGMDENLLWTSVILGGSFSDLLPAEPGSPAEGLIVVLDETHATHPNELAVFDEATWHYRVVPVGTRLFNEAAGSHYELGETAWTTGTLSGGDMIGANNLSDVANPATARANLSVYSTGQVDSAIAAAVTGLLDLKGNTDCSANPNYPAASKGDTYVVSVAGKIGGGAGQSVDVGDVFWATADNAGGTQASVGTNWAIIEHNLVGAIVGAGALLAANNLSDLASPAAARANLGLLTVTTQAGTTYTAALGDAETYVRFTNGSAVTFTVPPNGSVAFPIGTVLEIEQSGAGALTIAPGSGVTINSRGADLTLAGQYAVAALKKVATDTWTLTGDL